MSYIMKLCGAEPSLAAVGAGDTGFISVPR